MISKSIIIIWSLFVLWNWISGMHNLPNDHSNATNVVLAMGFFFNVMLWFLVVVPMAVIGLLLKKTKKTA